MTEKLERLEQWVQAHGSELGNLLFYISLAIYIFVQVFTVSFAIDGFNAAKMLVILNICMAMLLFKEVLIHKLDWRSLIGLFALLVFAELYWHANNRWAIMMLVYIFSARTVSFKVSSWIYIVSVLLGVAIVIAMALFGMIPNYALEIGGRLRWTLGFTYTLVPATMVLSATMLWVCARKDDLSWWEWAALLILNGVLFAATKSRFPFLIALLTLLIALVLKIRPNLLAEHRRLRLAAVPVFAVFALGSLAATVGYMKNAAWAVALNSHLDHRIMLAAKAFKKVGFRLLGYDYNMIGNGLNLDGVSGAEEFGKYTYIDNMYMQFLLKEGILFFVLVIALTTWLMYKLVDQEKRGYLLSMMVLLSVQSVLQDVYLTFYYNLFLLLYGIVLLRTPEEDGRETPLLDAFRAKIGRRKAVPVAEPPEPEPVDDRYIL